MMKLAVNYSRPLVNLIEQDAIKIDLIKCPDWEGMIQESEQFGPVTLHYDLKAGLGDTFEVDFSRIRDLMVRTGTPHVNTHLVTPRQFDPNNPKEVLEINQLWRDEIQLLVNQFGADKVALEHFPYTEATPHIRFATDSRTFNKVIEDTRCMFLLDLAHACITADSLGVDAKTYIASLPVERLVEMHITGIRSYAGILTDHFPLAERDWQIFTWALEEINAGRWRMPEIVAFEYGGVGDTFVWRTSIEAIRTQVPKLYQLVHEH